MATKRKQQAKFEKHIDSAVLDSIGNALKEYTGAMEDAEKRRAKDKFMDLYQKAEYAYKRLLIDDKIKVENLEPIPGYRSKDGKKSDKKFNPDNLHILDSQVEKILLYANIVMDKKLFSMTDEFRRLGNKSCRCLRNEITHNSSKKAIDEVYTRKEELFTVIKSFLSVFDTSRIQQKKTA